MNHCTKCGSPLTQSIPKGDDRPRYVCTNCGHIHYLNPRMVVGTIPVWENEILLVRRSIEPKYGLWTLPAGFLENGETVMEGARRESTEEANAKMGELIPFGLFNLTQVNQIYFMFRGNLQSTDFSPGYESLETRLFKEDEIPWDSLAFTVIRVTLEIFFKDRINGSYGFHMEDIYF